MKELTDITELSEGCLVHFPDREEPLEVTSTNFTSSHDALGYRVTIIHEGGDNKYAVGAVGLKRNGYTYTLLQHSIMSFILARGNSPGRSVKKNQGSSYETGIRYEEH